MADSTQLLIPIGRNTGIPEPIIDAKSAANTTGVLPQSFAGLPVETTWYVVFGATADSGVVKIETAHDANYAGTWVALATVTFAAASTVQVVSITGIYQAMRARISTAVTTGNLSVYLLAGSRA